MGAFLDKPKTDKTTNSGESNGLKYASSAMQGWRMEMEDSDVCATNLSLKGWSFFGVFDGHAGTKVSKHCSERLWKSIESHLSNKTNPSVDEVKQALEKGFIDLDEQMRKDSPWSTGEDHSGSTAVTVLISPTHIFWANCGDSRSIFCSGGELQFSTVDHKPSNQTEKDRIEKAGGTVMMQRVNGTLAVSRALGDFDYKRDTTRKSIEQLVSPQPEITVIERKPEKDEFLLLACDGIYDVMKNEEVITFIRHKLHLMELVEACNKLIDTCLMKNSRDNMSVVLVTFPAAPSISEESIAEEEKKQSEIDETIYKHLKEMVDKAADPLEVEEGYVFQTIATSMPPECSVYEKKQYISETLEKLTENKFGVQGTKEFSGPSDPSHAPSELQLEGDHHIMLGTDRDDDEPYHSYDSTLLDMNNQINEDDKADDLGEEEENMDTTQGEESVTHGNESPVDTT